jgi:hypothetical protein
VSENGGIARWLESRWAIPVLALLAAVPLFWPDIPPLTDLPGHMGRYAVQLESDPASPLHQYYRFDWALIGNLGVDLLMVPMSNIFGLERAVKLIVIAIPMITVLGYLLVSRSVHGRIQPTALFAIPLALAFPFQFGFVNFSLSVGLAFLSLWLWRTMRPHVIRRSIAFGVIALLLWLCHIYGWALAGILCFSDEIVAQFEAPDGRLIQKFWRAVCVCLTLATPLVPMLLTYGGSNAGETFDWFNLSGKLYFALSVFQDRWMGFDLAAFGVVIMTIWVAARRGRRAFAAELGLATGLMLVVYLLMPRVLLGSAFADMRLVPVMLATALLSIRVPTDQARGWLLTGAAFCAVRLIANTLNMAHYDQAFDRELAALDKVPVGARLLSFVGKECATPWQMPRLDHLPALAIVRRKAFSNDQWNLSGGQLLTVTNEAAAGFRTDPSQFVTDDACNRPDWRTLTKAMKDFPRGAFDFVWVINVPVKTAPVPGDLNLVWHKGKSRLYRVTHGNGV